jgi:hypothetical protein
LNVNPARLPSCIVVRSLAALALAAGLFGCAQLPALYSAAVPATPAAKPDLVLACRMLKASYCAYDVSTRTYDAATHSARMDRCESRAELQREPKLAQTVSPPPFAWLSPGGTNAFLILQTSQDEIVIAFRGTIGLGAGLSGYFDWLNNFQAARVSDPLLGNVHSVFTMRCSTARRATTCGKHCGRRCCACARKMCSTAKKSTSPDTARAARWRCSPPRA